MRQLRPGTSEIVRNTSSVSSAELDELSLLHSDLLLLASDIYQSQTLMRNIIEKGDARCVSEHLERALHMLNAICIYRANEILQSLPESPRSAFVYEHVDAIRSHVNSIRFSLPGDVNSAVDKLCMKMRATLAEVCPGTEDYIIELVDPSLYPLDSFVLSELQNLCQQLTISSGDDRQQNGFGYTLSTSELLTELLHPGARLFMLRGMESISGFAIIQTERESFPAEVKEQIGRLEVPQDDRVGWLSIVGIAPSAGIALYRSGISSYELLAGALVQMCRGAGIEKLYGEVRVGEKAPNVSRKSHLRLGFETTGLLRKHNGYEYELLTASSDTIPFYVNRNVLGRQGSKSDLLISDLPPLQKIFCEWTDRSPSTLKLDEICCLNGNSADADSVIRAFKEKGRIPHSIGYVIERCSDGLVLQFRYVSTHFTVRQLFPNQDLWSYDRASNSHEIKKFHDILEVVSKDLRANY